MFESPWSKLRSRVAGSGLDFIDLMSTAIFGAGAAGALAFGKFLLGVFWPLSLSGCMRGWCVARKDKLRTDHDRLITLDVCPKLLRAAKPADRKALESLQWRASLNNPGDREALLANPDAIELPLQQIESGGVFVAEAAGSIVGFAAILPRSDGDSELDALFVEPELWRQGVGRALVEHCCVAAKASGARVLHVVGNPHAEGFYEACGFKQVGKKKMRFGVGLLMEQALH